MANVVIFGTGQTAEIVYDYLVNDTSHKIVAFTVDSKYLIKKKFFELPVVPFEKVEEIYSPSEYKMFVAIGYKNLNELRAKKYLEAKKKNYKLINYISSKSGITAKSIEIGDNCFISENQSIQPYSKIGNNVALWGGVLIGHNCKIGDHCWITSEVSIAGNTIIGSYCFIGVNATIGHMITIGEKCLIGAGTLITKDAKDKSVFIAKDTQLYPLESDKFMQITKLK